MKCDCGHETTVCGNDLRRGKTTQCRTCRGSVTIDLQGLNFGHWTVIKEGFKKNGKIHWICRCSCGVEENVCAASLKKGVSTKCVQCYRKEMPVHGYSCHPLYPTWSTMIARCENEKNNNFKNYGRRGIKVCERWHNIESFLEDMGERPSKKHSIDRIDVEGDYCPENCRWSTSREQGRNRRTNKIFEYDSQRRCLSDWASVLNINVDTLSKYLTRHDFPDAYKHFTH